MDGALDLSPFFYTKAQALDFSTRLSSIINEIYQTGFNLEKSALQQLGIDKKDKFITLLRNAKINSQSPYDLKSFLEQIQQRITEIPLLSLTIAFEPQVQTMEALSDWFSINLKQQVLFEFKVQPELIAGAQITFKGKYHDGALKEKIEQIIQEALKPATTPLPVEQPFHQSVENIHL